MQGFDLNVYQLYLNRAVVVEKAAQAAVGALLAIGARRIAAVLVKPRGPRD